MPDTSETLSATLLVPLNTHNQQPWASYIPRTTYYTLLCHWFDAALNALNADRHSSGNGFHLRVQRGLTVPLSSTGKRTTRRAATMPTLGEWPANTHCRYIAISLPLRYRYISVTLPLCNRYVAVTAVHRLRAMISQLQTFRSRGCECCSRQHASRLKYLGVLRSTW